MSENLPSSSSWVSAWKTKSVGEFDLDDDLAACRALGEGDQDAAGEVFADLEGDFIGAFLEPFREAMFSRSMPMLLRIDSSISGPEPPERLTKVLASWIAWVWEISVMSLLNKMSDRISLVGFCGFDWKESCGDVRGPWSIAVTVRSVMLKVPLRLR